eukprot:gnl/TRDRNA2_/TRDRNA2_34180_c1_seq1.p1 gnl/TRDRNA2_/TRDRNA2_34180_c1~~gnl/TRDRNA2_/TRDRNA2_34180_c1_seq1.p1  ORF type:complete len:466 (+),score=61.78 gnl/TRDRNA2_/TRDRNA2_34180_c1_seq1:136-1398(+)
MGLIVAVQLLGASLELALVWRLRRLDMLPTKELIVLLSALFIEFLRMFLVDVFVLQDYFGGREYSVFKAPVPCAGLRSDDWAGHWTGADGVEYCRDTSAMARYYIASHREAYTAHSRRCSTFTNTSALLDYDENTSWGGHPRFTRIGWVVGGEFALYYFFAAFINEVADNMFVVPTTAGNGWLCKLFSVALELFQLGALCPAAIFVHSDCLHYTDPLGVSLQLIRGLVVAFGYCIWGFMLAMAPLGIFGAVLVGSLFCVSGACFRCCAWPAAACRCRRTVENLDKWRRASEQLLLRFMDIYQQSQQNVMRFTMLLAFLPLLLGGMFLGTLVVVGQASKQGEMQVITAIVLLSDVLFKIIATVVVEAFDYALHLRVRRAVAVRGRQDPDASVVGRSLTDQATHDNAEVQQPQQYPNLPGTS